MCFLRHLIVVPTWSKQVHDRIKLCSMRTVYNPRMRIDCFRVLAAAHVVNIAINAGRLD
jgi:hypothetical protein